MATSISDREPQVIDGSPNAAEESVRLTVTGLDENGQMFRETTDLLSLDGRDCRYRSKFQPELGTWVLAEIKYLSPGAKSCTLQGQVKSVQPEGVATGLQVIQLELEAPQAVKVSSGTEPAAAKPQKLQPMTVAVPKIEAKETPKAAPAQPAVPAKQEAKIQPGLSSATPSLKPASPTSEKVPPPAKAENPVVDNAAVKSAIVSEMNRQFGALKSSLSKELDQMVQAAVSASVERTIREAVEKQISANYQASIKTLNSDLAHQLAGRLAENGEVRASIEGMAKKVLDEQAELSSTALTTAREKLESRAAEITQAFEASIAETEKKTNAVSGSAAATLERAQALEREVAEATQQLQKAVEQLNQSARSAAEKFDGHMTAQLNLWSSQFKNHLDVVSRENAARFTTELEKHLSTYLLDADQAMEKLTAGLQLMQGTIRLQEERLAELSLAASAGFEKEIKSLLVRLADTV